MLPDFLEKNQTKSVIFKILLVAFKQAFITDSFWREQEKETTFPFETVSV